VVDNCSRTCNSSINLHIVLKSCLRRLDGSRLMKQQRTNSLEQLSQGHQCVKLVGSMAFASPQHKTYGRSGKKPNPLKISLAAAVQRRQQIIWNVPLSESRSPSNGNPSPRLQTKPNPKSARAPFGTFLHNEDITVVLQRKSPTS
jgi:hypothetical protein